MDAQRLKDFTKLTKRKREVEAELRVIKDDLKAQEAVLRDQFAEDGIKSTNIDGMTVYVHRQWWARPLDDKQLSIAALNRHPIWRDFVEQTFNVMTVSARVRELTEEVADEHPDWSDEQILKKGVPAGIRDHLFIEREYKIRARQG